MSTNKMVVPKELIELIEAGKWPREQRDWRARDKVINGQQFAPLMPKERVTNLIPDESLIILFTPPFTPLEGGVSKLALHLFVGAPDRIYSPGDLDFTRCLVIADFGLGSDSPIVLDYRSVPENPPVLRLRWGTDGIRFRNRWVAIAPTFRIRQTFRILRLEKRRRAC